MSDAPTNTAPTDPPPGETPPTSAAMTSRPPTNEAFAKQMADGYTLDQPALLLGSPMLDNELYNGTHVQVALSILNRHGLIAGATGTGKTKTLQLMAGQLSKAGVPCFVADIKGEVTGMAAAG